MRIVSWNVNSIRARTERVTTWLHRHEPDIVLLQETKCTNEVFAELAQQWIALGYEFAHAGVNQWNGVAIGSRVGAEDVEVGFGGVNQPPFDEPRLISATCAGIRVHNVYVPNGRELDDPHYLYKLVWLERLRQVVDPDRMTVVAGDFNVAPADIDIYDPSRFRRSTHASPQERAAIQALCDLGLVDVSRLLHPEPGIYTFWNYRPGQFERNRGLRIDLALCSPDMAVATQAVWVDSEERAPLAAGAEGEKPSDHAPLILDLKM